MQPLSTFAEWMRRRRKELDLTQAELAARVDCAMATIKKIEQQTRKPSRQLAELLADQLAIPAPQRDDFLRLARGEYVETAPPAPQPNPNPFLTPFLGREQELTFLRHAFMHGGARLVTLVGPGGIGKTRLALQLMHTFSTQQPPAFADGHFLVSLAGLATPAAMVTAIGSTLGISFHQNLSPQRQLCDELGTKQILLVLDNLEHLLNDTEFDVAAFLLALLLAAPDLRVIITSRARLNVQSEQLYPIGGLTYPEDDEDAFQDVAKFSAVHLFVQHAQRIQPSFDLQHANGRAVVQICRLVEGLPLGIELAASWIRVMSCTEIAAELARGFDILSTTLHDLPQRHRNMRNVFEGSWLLLSAKEQDALRQLAVFRGGFMREAAESIAGLTLPVLARLVDFSLVQRQSSGRFDLHELLRQFLEEKLYANPREWEQSYRRHGAYYGAQFAKIAWLHGMTEGTPDQKRGEAALPRVAPEIDNVESAWQWAVQHQDTQTIRQLMNALAGYYHEIGIWEEGSLAIGSAIQAIQAVEAMLPEEKNSLLASLLLRRALIMNHNRQDATLTYLDQAMAFARHTTSHSRWELALMFVHRGLALLSKGDNGEAIISINEGLSIFREKEDTLGVWYALITLGRAELRVGRLVKAADALTEAVKITDGKTEVQYWLAAHLLGNTYMLQGYYDQAESLLDGAINYFTNALPFSHMLAFFLRNRGDLAIAQGDFDQAAAYFAKATPLFERARMPWHVAIPLCSNSSVMARLQGNLDAAERGLTQDVEIARKIGFQHRIATNLNNLARLRHDQARYHEEKSLLDEALQIARQFDSGFVLALVMCQLGHTLAALDRPEAINYYGEALRIACEEQLDRVSLEILTGFAQHEINKGEYESAVILLRLVQDHSASDFETKRTATRKLAKLASQSPPNPTAQVSQHEPLPSLQEIISNLLDDHLIAHAASSP